MLSTTEMASCMTTIQRGAHIVYIYCMRSCMYVRIPKQPFHGQLKSGKRSQQEPKKRFKDNLNSLHVHLQHWEELILNLTVEALYREGCKSFEEECLRYAQTKRVL